MIGRIGRNQQIEAQAHLQTIWSKLAPEWEAYVLGLVSY
jgi:hypothetical protein